MCALLKNREASSFHLSLVIWQETAKRKGEIPKVDTTRRPPPGSGKFSGTCEQTKQGQYYYISEIGITKGCLLI